MNALKNEQIKNKDTDTEKVIRFIRRVMRDKTAGGELNLAAAMLMLELGWGEPE